MSSHCGAMLQTPYQMLALITRHRGVAVALCLVTLALVWSFRLPHPCVFGDCNADTASTTADTTAAPVAAPVTYHETDLSDPEAPFIGWPLARVCQETEWVDGLVFICDENSGGIGNIRGYTLTCLRYAIEAGATGLVMPRIRTRSTKDLSDIMQEYRDFDYMFDADHFRTSLTTNCPRIKIYDNAESGIPNFKEPYQPERIRPRPDFGNRDGCHVEDLNRHTSLFGPRFRQWLADKGKELGLPPTSLSHPRVIRPHWGVQLEWPIYQDGPEFASTYGGLLRLRKDILQLGKKTVEAMRDFASTAVHPTSKGKYVGFHLRTESDALDFWPSFETQTSAYLREAAARGLKAAYLATGNSTEAAKLAERAQVEHGMAVTMKQDLLKDHPEDLAALQALSWDQQALIDFIVLLASDFFLGANPSSFSVNVALKRHVHADGLRTRPWKIGRDDGRSLLVGRFERYWGDWLYMYDSIWP